MKKNHDIYHSWMRNSLSGLTCLHLLEIREQSMSYPMCSKWSHFHLSVSDVKTSSPNIWPSVTFWDISPMWETGYVPMCACVHIYARTLASTRTSIYAHTPSIGLCCSTAKHYPVFSSQWLFPGILLRRLPYRSPIKMYLASEWR